MLRIGGEDLLIYFCFIPRYEVLFRRFTRIIFSFPVLNRQFLSIGFLQFLFNSTFTFQLPVKKVWNQAAANTSADHAFAYIPLLCSRVCLSFESSGVLKIALTFERDVLFQLFAGVS